MTQNKRKFGEVFTPPSLVNEMLDTLPPEVWKNPNLKWLDNSCGKGAFLVEIKQRLLKYHSLAQISVMLYGVDIQKDCTDETHDLLNGCGVIVCADYLMQDTGKFDIIVGNPPYNKDKGSKKGNTCNPLWPDFVKKSLDDLNDGGYLLYVHPPLYRKPEHKLWELMRQYQFHKMRFFTLEKSSKIFGCAVKVDYYLLQKVKATGTTDIIDETNAAYELAVYDKKFISNHSLDLAYKVFGGKTDVIYSCDYHHHTHKDYMLPEIAMDYVYPCVYSINKKGLDLYWSKRNDRGHFGIPKLIVSMGTLMPILDLEGSYGMCEVAFGIPVSSQREGELLLGAFSNPKFREFMLGCKWKTVQYDYRLFKYFDKTLDFNALFG